MSLNVRNTVASLALGALASAAFTSPVHATSSELARRVAIGVGFDAAALAAAGIDAVAVVDLLARLDALPQAMTQFESASATAATAAAALALAQQQASDGDATAIAQIPTLQGALANATSDRDALRSIVRDIAVEGLAVEESSALANIDAARAMRVPTEFMVVARTHEAWAEIEAGVRREARCLRLGQPVESEVAELLSAVRAEPSVVAAAARLAAHRAAIEAQLALP
jgi:hypothetical protein